MRMVPHVGELSQAAAAWCRNGREFQADRLYGVSINMHIYIYYNIYIYIYNIYMYIYITIYMYIYVYLDIYCLKGEPIWRI